MCMNAAVSQNETLSTGSVEKPEFALYYAHGVQIYRTEWLYFSLYLMCLYLK